jgi:isopenicillin-N epimerase
MLSLGAAIRDEWLLDPSQLTVNHGAYGATPKAVLEAQDRWRRKLEEQPSYFMRRILPDALRAGAEKLADFLGADGKDLVFVDNATVGCNAILRSLWLKPDDEILLLNHSYGAVRNTARYVAELAGAKVVEAEVPFPRPTVETIVANVAASITPKTRIAIIDHITSPNALLLPLKRLIDACHSRNVPVLVDGAHGPAHVAIDLSLLDADWYVGNCHKWLMAPKGCGFLWARPDRQEGLHPVTISHGYGKGYLAEFDWTGTRDPSAFLAVEDAIQFHRRLGGANLRARNMALARDAGEVLARRLNMDVGADAPVASAMAVVRLPISGEANRERAQALRLKLLDDFRTDAPLHALDGSIWVRVSAQAYNEIDDYHALGDILAKFAQDI